MNISTVNELIASLENAGELSIREQKFLKLAKAFKQLAAENVEIRETIEAVRGVADNSSGIAGWHLNGEIAQWSEILPEIDDIETPATDRIVAGIKADGRVEGAHFVANRMLAAWDAGFIEDTAKNAADIARMILASTEFMAGAPEGDFDRSFADGILEDIAKQLREGAK
ncbi:ead/Ea22-like family protein [Klebsiella pneumoniae]|uniref:ead/Ea22-like family protein n=1 Tax=Klebsiella pneumoniae TaxID=573 RepID=UPI000F45AAF8|nr:ead/Ea22-like family protein [Klebsiella pneumoniae]ROH16107.1 ead/Ea22-like family protein [Klebsiella pneumoniae]